MDFLTIVAGGKTPEDSTVKRNLSFFLAESIFTYIFELNWFRELNPLPFYIPHKRCNSEDEQLRLLPHYIHTLRQDNSQQFFF
jgi:hypothetical protein